VWLGAWCSWPNSRRTRLRRIKIGGYQWEIQRTVEVQKNWNSRYFILSIPPCKTAWETIGIGPANYISPFPLNLFLLQNRGGSFFFMHTTIDQNALLDCKVKTSGVCWLARNIYQIVSVNIIPFTMVFISWNFNG